MPMLLCTSGLNMLFYTQAKELDTNTDYYLELLSKGVGKPKEELAEFLNFKSFQLFFSQSISSLIKILERITI